MYQVFVDYEQCGDQYYVGIVEVGQGFVEGKGFVDVEGYDYQQGDYVQVQVVVDEEGDGGGEQVDYLEQFEVYVGI